MLQSFRQRSRNRRACREQTAHGSGGVGSAPSLVQRAAAADEGDRRAATADRLAPVDRRPASRLAALHRNDRPGRRGPKSVAAWTQLRLEAPVGHALHCRVAARSAAIGEKRDRSGGRSSPSRKGMDSVTKSGALQFDPAPCVRTRQSLSESSWPWTKPRTGTSSGESS